MGYARHIGRVGALAVALGVGAAVATTPGIAWAQEGGTDSAPSSASGPESGSQPDASPSEPSTDADPGSDIDAAQGDDTEAGAEQGSTGTTTITQGQSPPVTISNSGGAQDDDPESEADTDAEDEPGSPADEVPEPTDPPLGTEPEPGSHGEAPPAVTDDPPPVSTPDSDDPPASTSDLAGGSDPTVADDSGASRLSMTMATDQDTEQFDTLQANTFSAMQTNITTTPVDPVSALMGLPNTLINVAATFVTAVLSPFLVPGPGAPAQPPLLWAVFAWVRREIQHTFFNRTPTLSPQTTGEDTDDGQIHGTLGADDRDDDELSFSVPEKGQPNGPANGTVTIDEANGTWTYTPDAGFTGDDEFTLTVTDDEGAFHLHGLFGFFSPGGRHTDTATVEVTVGLVDPVDTAPQVTSVVRNPPGADGSFTGSFLVTDADGDELDISLDDVPAYGTVAFTNTEVNDTTRLVTYTYTSTISQAEQVRAGLSPEDELDTFSFTITDGESTPVGVSVDNIAVAKYFAVDGDVVEADGALRIVTSPDGRKLYVSNGTAGTVTVIDGATGLAETINVGGGPYGMAVVPDGRVYVGSLTGNYVTVINTDNSTETISGVAGGPIDVAANADGSRVYVSTLDGNVHVIRTDTDALVDTDTSTPGVADPITVGGVAIALAVHGNRLYVVSAAPVTNQATLHIIDTATNAPVPGATPVPVGQAQYLTDAAVTPDGGLVYVTNDTETVTIFNTIDGSVETIPIADAPTGVEVSPDGSVAYVSGAFDFAEDGATTDVNNQGKIVVIDTATGEVIDTIVLPNASVAEMTVSPDGTRLYVITGVANDFGAANLVVINLVDGENAPPTATATVDTDDIDHETGAVTVTITTSDADGDPVAFTVTTTPDKGSLVVVDEGDGTYTVTYTPDPQERVAAYGDVEGVYDGFRVIVSDGERSDVISVSVAVDPAPAAVIDTIDLDDVGGYPGIRLTDVAVDANGRAYTVVVLADDPEDPVTYSYHVVDVETGAVLASMPVTGVSDVLPFTSIAVSSDGSRVYVARLADDIVTVVDPLTGDTEDVVVGSGPFSLTVGPDGRVYVVNVYDGTVTVIDSDNTTGFVTPDPTLSQAFGMAVLADGTLYVTHSVGTDTNSVTVVYTDGNTESVTVGLLPTAVVASPLGDRVYVLNRFDNTVSIIDTSDNAVVGSPIPVEVGGIGNAGILSGMEISPDGGRLYVANPESGSVTIIDTATGVVVGSVPVGGSPIGIALNADGNRAYVTHADGTVSVLSISLVESVMV